MPTADLLADPKWYDALTLTERVRSFATASPRPMDAGLAARRLERWRAQTPFDDDALLAERLWSDGLSREDFLRVLGEPPGGPSATAQALPWLGAIERAFARPGGGPPLPWPPLERAPERAGFLDLVEPLVRAGCERLEAGLSRIATECPQSPLDPARGRELFLPPLAPRLLMMLARPLVLELNAARLLGQLSGETPEERFASFIRRLGGREEGLRLLATYPVLARQVVERIDQWVEASLEIAGHLAVDWDGLRAVFSPDRNPGRLATLQGGMGDSHRGGRAVVSLRFDSGLDLIYKPRSLAVETAFQGLLAWAGERGFSPTLRTPRVLGRGGHGWSERITAAGCGSAAGVRRFYERLGGHLALLYLLDAIDVHYENLIAAGEQPVLVDLEGLFHPRTDGDSLRLQEPLAGDALHHCLLRIGLLPQRLWSAPEQPGIDLSGISAAGGQIDPIPVLRLVDAGTDRMRFQRTEAETDPAQNVPTLDGRPVDPSRYRAEVAAGFERMYRLLLAHRGEILGPGSPLEAFAAAEVRIIVRPTRGYQSLLRESYHPDVLGNAILRDQLFDWLWAGVPHHPYLAELIPGERRALEQGDIPMLTTLAGSRDLWTGRGERIAGFFDRTGLERVAGNFAWMGEADLAFQLWTIEGSLKALSMPTNLVHRQPYGLREGERPAAPEELLAEARRVGDRIAALAARGRRDALWLALAPVGRSHWSFQPIGYELYNGLAGIAFFLAYLGARTGEERYTSLARAAWRPVEELLATRGGIFNEIGGFNGWGGFLYLLPHLAALWNEPEVLWLEGRRGSVTCHGGSHRPGRTTWWKGRRAAWPASSPSTGRAPPLRRSIWRSSAATASSPGPSRCRGGSAGRSGSTRCRSRGSPTAPPASPGRSSSSPPSLGTNATGMPPSAASTTSDRSTHRLTRTGPTCGRTRARAVACTKGRGTSSPPGATAPAASASPASPPCTSWTTAPCGPRSKPPCVPRCGTASAAITVSATATSVTSRSSSRPRDASACPSSRPGPTGSRPERSRACESTAGSKGCRSAPSSRGS